MSANPEQASISDRELVLTRLFDVPPEKVFRAWTEPDLLKQWLAPLPWTTPRAETDLRPGGASLIVMRSPEGVEYPNPGVYLEVVKNVRLVFTNAYTTAWEPSQQPFMTVVLTSSKMPAVKLVIPPARSTGRSPTASATSKWASIRAGGSVLTNWPTC